MDKGQFVEMAVSMGYSGKKDAMKYAESKDELSDDDFVKLYRAAAGKECRSLRGRYVYGANGKSTVSYGTMASNWWDGRAWG